jgi:hypothetical protein
MVKVSRRRKEMTYKVIMFVMLCQGNVINPVQKSEEFMCQTFSVVSFDRNENPNCRNCNNKKWMKQFKEMQ